MKGYSVYAKRSRRDGGFQLESVGTVHPSPEDCENHQCYCEGRAEEQGDDVQYVICEVRETDHHWRRDVRPSQI